MGIYNALHTTVLDLIHARGKSSTTNYTPELETTKGQIYLLIVTPKSYEQIKIQYVPEELAYKRAANFSEIQPIARNLPKYHYVGGKTTMTLNLSFSAREDGGSDVINIVRKLEALGSSDGYTGPKPTVILVWGLLFRGETWEVTNVDVKLKEFKPGRSFLPDMAFVSLSLSQVSEENTTWADITEEVSPIFTDATDLKPDTTTV